MNAPALAPSLFVSHGSPVFALQPGELGPRLAALGQALAQPRAVLVVSPHWQSHEVQVLRSARPATVHDFGGFPAPLYRLQYPAAGAPDVADETAEVLAQAGYRVRLVEGRGLDHGAWVPLRHLYPQAQVPVFQVSMPVDLDTGSALALGRALAPLRERGVMILGSGCMTHNLFEFRQGVQQPLPYAQEFADWVASALAIDSEAALLRYRSEAPHAERAHPTDEHLLPLLVAMGARRPGERAELLRGGITDGVISMDSVGWGLH